MATDHIVERAIAGDSDAFRQLYRQHRGDVARLVFRMLGNPRDVDDVVQDVFLQVYRTLRDFRGEAKFSTWLHRLTVNVVLMHRRSARSRPVYTDPPPDDISADPSAGPDEEAARRQRMGAFARILERISDKKRTVYVLHDLESIPPSEIAQILEIPVLTVRTRLFYARKEIAELMSTEPALAGLVELQERHSHEG